MPKIWRRSPIYDHEEAYQKLDVTSPSIPGTKKFAYNWGPDTTYEQVEEHCVDPTWFYCDEKRTKDAMLQTFLPKKVPTIVDTKLEQFLEKQKVEFESFKKSFDGMNIDGATPSKRGRSSIDVDDPKAPGTPE